MLRSLRCVLLLAAVGVGGAAMAACEYDEAALLALDYQAFDQDHSNGWRALSYRETAEDRSCVLAAANLIARYRELHRDRLKKDQDRLLAWHEGQIRAGLGDYVSAIPLLAVSFESSDRAFAIYAQATVAFLRRDREALLAERTRLSKLPKPDDWDTPKAQAERTSFKEKFGFEITWPPNLEVVDSLVGCFEATYTEAYSRSCRAAPRRNETASASAAGE